MKPVLFGGVLLLSIGLAVGLQCYKCTFTVWKLPCYTTKTQCNDDESCANITGTAFNKDIIKRKNCIGNYKCNTTSVETFAGWNYTTTYSCCNGDLCNTGTAVKFSLLSGLAMLAFWLPVFMMQLQ